MRLLTVNLNARVDYKILYHADSPNMYKSGSLHSSHLIHVLCNHCYASNMKIKRLLLQMSLEYYPTRHTHLFKKPFFCWVELSGLTKCRNMFPI